jgi:hypothetical protein
MRTLTEYERALRAECISLMGMEEADASLDTEGDNAFELFVWRCYQEQEPPASAAQLWSAIAQIGAACENRP